ncbi:MAG: MFS transporter [Hyphomonadaceae bacterium]|nr:MFS transporter [Hyphomonadaceae bacterium]
MSADSQGKLSLTAKLGWAIGELGIAVYVGVTMLFFLFYLTEAQGLPPAWAGLALLLPRLLDAIFDPFMGAISDRTRSKLGRRRLYVLVGSILYGAAFCVFLAMPDFSSQMSKVTFAVIAYIAASFAYSVMTVPYSAMTAEMTTDYRERTELVGYRMVAARLGIIGASVATPLIYASQASLADGFRLAGIVLGAFMTVTGLVTFFTTRDAPRIERPVQSSSIWKELRALTSNQPFVVLFLVFLCQNIAIGASATTLVYFLTFAMRADGAVIGPLLTVAGVAATVFTPPWVLVSKRIGKRPAYFLSLAIACVMALPAFFLPPSLLPLLFGVYLLSGIGDAGNQLLSNSMVPDTVEVDELKTGERREGALFGAWAFCLKCGMAAGAFLVSLVLDLSGFTGGGASEQSEAALLGIRISYCIIPFALWAAAIVLLRFYSLDEARFNEVKGAIQRRRSGAVHA